MLQNHFNFVIFTSEKQLYNEEAVICDSIEFRDNIDVIKEIEMSFKLLDEEARIPKGTARSWFDKLRRINNPKLQYMTFPTRRIGDIFVIKHYAGDVDYNPALFLEKNNENLNIDVINTMASSSDAIIFRMFARSDQGSHGNGNGSGSSAVSASSLASNGGSNANNRPQRGALRASIYDAEVNSEKANHAFQQRNKSLTNGNNNGTGTTTSTISTSTPAATTNSTTQYSNKSISWRFISQLTMLMNMLKKTQSHFIRCIKSNDACNPQSFESSLVYKQLTYSGVFEVVKIQQSGLPCRLSHYEYLIRYRCLL